MCLDFRGQFFFFFFGGFVDNVKFMAVLGFLRVFKHNVCFCCLIDKFACSCGG